MIFSIQPDGQVPIYEQIVAQVIYGIAAGTLEVGTFIPSVRELAETLLVHPNTVARAFQELERGGVVTARRGRGMEVTEDAPASCRAKRQDLVRARIRQALREAVASVLSPEEIRKLVEEELAAVNHRAETSSRKKPTSRGS
jgi:GntR family transcriptional regulator